MSMHEFTDPEGTGRCQVRPVFLGIAGAVEAKCLMTEREHAIAALKSVVMMEVVRRMGELLLPDDPFDPADWFADLDMEAQVGNDFSAPKSGEES